MVILLPPTAAPAAIRAFAAHGIAAMLVGEVVADADSEGAPYVEGPIEDLA